MTGYHYTPNPADYTPEPDLTPGQLAALTRAANERRARMTPAERASYDASMADPWAVKGDVR